MASKIILKNGQDQEFSITHPDNTGAININSDELVSPNAAEKTITMDGDLIPLFDSEDGNKAKNVKVSSLLARAGGGGSASDVYTGPYGFSWDSATDTYIRTGASGYTSIQSKMRRCVLNVDGTVNYYLHPTNSNFKADGTLAVLTGADGDVMVEIPRFYVKIETVGSVDSISISLTHEVGYTLHPAFMKGGIKRDFRYYRAYEGTVVSGALRSISGATPTRTQTIATFRTQATSRAGWHLTDYALLNAVKILCYVEFADLIVTKYLGEGNYDGSDYGRITGVSNTLGNRNSTAPNTTFMSYRGIEDFYANDWEFIDGVNINNYQAYVNNNPATFASDVFTGDYVAKGSLFIAGASASYIKRCNITLEGGFIPTVIGGAATTFYGDGCWSATGARVLLHGGNAYHGSLAGASAVSVYNASSGSAADIVASVCR